MQDLEKILTEAALEQKINAPTEAWPFIADALHKRKKRKPVWYFLFVFILLIGTIIIYNISNPKPSIKNSDLVNTKKNIFKNNDTATADLTLGTDNTAKNNDTTKKITYKKSAKNNLNLDKIIGVKNSSDILENEKLFDKNNFIYKRNGKRKITVTSAEIEITNDKTGSTQKTNITTKEEKIFDKNVITSELNGSYKIKIIPAETEFENIVLTNIDLPKTDSNSIKNLALTNSVIENLKYEQIQKSNSNIINKDTTNNFKEISATKLTSITNFKNKKWDSYFAISYAVLLINTKNFFREYNNSFYPNLSQAVSPNSSQIGIAKNANYFTGREISFSYLLKKENKKFNPTIGITFNAQFFNTKAYTATSALFDYNTSTIDSTQVGNSRYTAKNSRSASEVKVKNYLLQIGVPIGATFTLYYKKRNSILLQTQLVPTINLFQNIQWLDNRTSRYFTSKAVDNKFNIGQFTSVLWQAKIKNRTILLGPYYNFNYFKINKSINAISNIYTQRIGMQLQIKK